MWLTLCFFNAKQIQEASEKSDTRTFALTQGLGSLNAKILHRKSKQFKPQVCRNFRFKGIYPYSCKYLMPVRLGAIESVWGTNFCFDQDLDENIYLSVHHRWCLALRLQIPSHPKIWDLQASWNTETKLLIYKGS